MAFLGRAAAKNRVSGDWNLFNDERVEGLEPYEVQAASAYVLFYTKVSRRIVLRTITRTVPRAVPRTGFRIVIRTVVTEPFLRLSLMMARKPRLRRKRFDPL